MGFFYILCRKNRSFRSTSYFMKIAIFSDSHDNKANLLTALRTVKEKGAEAILFCGDFCAPFMAKMIAENFDKPIHIVFGNNDGDKYTMLKVIKDFKHVTFHGEYASLELGGKRIGMTHYPFYAKAMAKSGDFDLVAFGHDHAARVETYGAALAVNPGCLYEETNDISPSFALYDTVNNKATLHKLDGSFLDV